MHETTEEVHFHWIDYAVLGLSLALTVGIGVFFYFYDRRRHKESDANEYNMGGRDMNPVTTGMSIMASFINATFLIGNIYYQQLWQYLTLPNITSLASIEA